MVSHLISYHGFTSWFLIIVSHLTVGIISQGCSFHPGQINLVNCGFLDGDNFFDKDMVELLNRFEELFV